MPTWRKAALVIASLDPDVADQLLDGLPADAAQSIRDQVMGLARVEQGEQRAALRDFLQRPAVPRTTPSTSPPGRHGSDLRAATGRDANVSVSRIKESESSAMARATERLIADCLREEMPQAITVALAALPTSRASEVIAHLPEHLQAEVLERLVEYEPTRAAESTEAREIFHGWLNEQLTHALHRAEIATRLASLLESSHPGTRDRILQTVATSDASLAREMRAEQLGTETASAE